MRLAGGQVPAVIEGASLQAAPEIVERSFAYGLAAGMRRTWLRGRENVHKRYLLPSPATTYRC